MAGAVAPTAREGRLGLGAVEADVVKVHPARWIDSHIPGYSRMPGRVSWCSLAQAMASS